MAPNDTLAGNSSVGSNQQQHDVDATATGYIDHIDTNCFLLNFHKFLNPTVPLDVMNMFIATLTNADFTSSKIFEIDYRVRVIMITFIILFGVFFSF